VEPCKKGLTALGRDGVAKRSRRGRRRLNIEQVDRGLSATSANVHDSRKLIDQRGQPILREIEL
jgi:hypothetical protein